MHVDGYAGFEQLTAKGNITLAACWAHTRRKFYDIAEADKAPLALEALRRISRNLCRRSTGAWPVACTSLDHKAGPLKAH